MCATLRIRNFLLLLGSWEAGNPEDAGVLGMLLLPFCW